MSDTRYSRRRLLASGATATLAGLAGCGSVGGNSSSGKGIRLPSLYVQNDGDSSHAVDLLVQRDGEIAHWQTHDLSPGEMAIVEASWPEDAATFDVKARVDEAARRTTTFGDGTGTDGCVRLKLYVRERDDGTPYFSSFWTGDCSASSLENATDSA